MKQYCFAILWLLIGLVSAFDTFWLVKCRESIYECEQNPVERLLIELDGGDVSLFVGVKFLGTVLVLGILFLMFSYSKKLGITCADPLAAFQVWLAWYLMYA